MNQKEIIKEINKRIKDYKKEAERWKKVHKIEELCNDRDLYQYYDRQLTSAQSLINLKEFIRKN